MSLDLERIRNGFQFMYALILWQITSDWIRSHWGSHWRIHSSSTVIGPEISSIQDTGIFYSNLFPSIGSICSTQRRVLEIVNIEIEGIRAPKVAFVLMRSDQMWQVLNAQEELRWEEGGIQ